MVIFGAGVEDDALLLTHPVAPDAVQGRGQLIHPRRDIGRFVGGRSPKVQSGYAVGEELLVAFVLLKHLITDQVRGRVIVLRVDQERDPDFDLLRHLDQQGREDAELNGHHPPQEEHISRLVRFNQSQKAQPARRRVRKDRETRARVEQAVELLPVDLHRLPMAFVQFDVRLPLEVGRGGKLRRWIKDQ